MTTDHIGLREQRCWSNLAKKCHDRDVRRIQSGLRNEGANMIGKLVTEANRKSEQPNQAEVPDKSDLVASGLQAENLPIVFHDSEDTEVPTRYTRTTPKISSKAGYSVYEDSKASTSGIAHELIELRLHMIKEEERFRLQNQNIVNKQVQRDKTPDGAAKWEQKPEKLKGQVEQRRKLRSPLKNQTNILMDDLRGKLSGLLKQRRELREQDRLLRLQLDEMRAQWEESVQQVEQARIEKAKILNQIDSVMG